MWVAVVMAAVEDSESDLGRWLVFCEPRPKSRGAGRQIDPEPVLSWSKAGLHTENVFTKM